MVSRSRRLRYYAIESGQSQAFSAQILEVFCTFRFIAPIRWFIFTILVFAAGFSAFFRRCFRVSLKFSPQNFVCFFSAQAFCAPFPAREAIRIGRRLLSALWAAPAAFLSACRPVPKNQAQQPARCRAALCLIFHAFFAFFFYRMHLRQCADAAMRNACACRFNRPPPEAGVCTPAGGGQRSHPRSPAPQCGPASSPAPGRTAGTPRSGHG